MADNTPFVASLDPASPKIADLEVTHSGDQAKVQLIVLTEVTGSEGAYTLRRLTALDTLLQSLLGSATAADAGTGTGDVAITGAASGLRLMGFAARETTAAAGAVFNIRRGTAASDPIMAPVTLGVNESVREWYGPDGLAADAGIYLDRVSGTTQVVGYYKVVV